MICPVTLHEHRGVCPRMLIPGTYTKQYVWDTSCRCGCVWATNSQSLLRKTTKNIQHDPLHSAFTCWVRVTKLAISYPDKKARKQHPQDKENNKQGDITQCKRRPRHPFDANEDADFDPV